VRDETGHPSTDPHRQQKFPSFAQIAGYMLDTLFMDGLYSDLERMTRINQLIDAVPPDKRSGALTKMRAIDTMVIVPSKDLRAIAYKHRREMPLPVRGLLRGIGGRNQNENRLLSFLLFEQGYTRELIELGYNDAMSEKDQLLDFVTGKEVPRLFAPDWVTMDLSGFS
jgi:NTE family protein